MGIRTFENLTITRQGLLLIALPCLFQAAFLAVLLEVNREVSRAQFWALHSKQVIARTEGVYRKLVEAHGAVRGLLLTGLPVFDEQFQKSAGEADAELLNLERDVRDNASQQAMIREIRARSEALIGWQRQTADLARAGRRAEAMVEVRNLTGKSMLDNLRGEIDRFLRTEAILDADRNRELVEGNRWQTIAVTAGGVLVVALTLALGYVIGRGLTTRFGVLNENVARLAEGKELSSPLEGRDELAKLDGVFRSMARAIVEKNRENEMFIYSVSHDLRSPLVNLQGFSQELGHAAKDLKGVIEGSELPEQARSKAMVLIDQEIGGSIHFIQTAVSRLSAIIDALLRLSRVGRVEYRVRELDLDQIVSRVVEALGSTIAERKATLEVEPLPRAWGDPTAVEQVFANLIGNALNYLDPARPGVVRVRATGQTGSGLNTYEVWDNGRGIPASGLSKLFLAFQRFHEGAAKGEGIGLALVRRIVERHGGAIRVESEVGVGSRFQVDLPSRAPEPSGDPNSQRLIEGKGSFV